MHYIDCMRAVPHAALLFLLLTVASCAAGGGGAANLPPPGTPVFGPRGLIGTVGGQAGGTAIVNPVGGGAPGIMVPNANGTATIVQPGGPPVTIANPAR